MSQWLRTWCCPTAGGITAQSTGSRYAGPVTVSAFRLRLGYGAAISTDAEDLDRERRQHHTVGR
jgi:hypothetical protein